MSGPRSISKSSLINAADRFRRLGPPSVRAWLQLRHLQKAYRKGIRGGGSKERDGRLLGHLSERVVHSEARVSGIACG